MIKVENLHIAFGDREVVHGISFELPDGKTLGLVGESGSGKSVTALSIMGLLSDDGHITEGTISLNDKVLCKYGKTIREKEYCEFRGDSMTMVFQEPMTSLNPVMKIKNQLEEMLLLSKKTFDKATRQEMILAALKEAGIKECDRVLNSYPHQISGGQRQRVMIAMAVMLCPGFIVADEPTTALDVTIQAQIIALLKELNEKHNNSMLFITHDLGLAKSLCDYLAVMKDGEIVEMGKAKDVFESPKNEYTKALVEAASLRGSGREIDAKINAKEVVKVDNLTVRYPIGQRGLFIKNKKYKEAVKNATFVIREGETVGLVGESGCGKTTLSKALLGMIKDISGSFSVMADSPQMIFQDPYGSLNPAMTVGELLEEPLKVLPKDKRPSDKEIKVLAHEMLGKVKLADEIYYRYPSELSGGQRQRISIAQALITKPKLCIADEPLSALDVTTQGQIMELINELQKELSVAFLFISHDILLVSRMSDRVLVMKDGVIVEQGETKEVFNNPKEEYTKVLLSSVLSV